MNDKQYLSKLEKALASLSKQRREEILAEIRSHIAEAGTQQDNLLNRFGDPAELAEQYLEGEETESPVAAKVKGIGKKLIFIVGGVTTALIVIIASAISLLSGDDFDYSDENAPELTDNRNLWGSVNAQPKIQIDIDQAKVAIYWHDKTAIDWKCDGDTQPSDFDKSSIKIRQNNCLVYLPNQPISINTDQSKVILVRPMNDLNLQIHQTKLDIVEASSGYRYQIEKSRSNLETLVTTTTEAPSIQITAFESSIAPYQYD